MSTSKSRSKKDDSANPDLNLASIGNYTFVKTLGEGNFAKVKLAKHKLTAAEVAVKIIDKSSLDDKKLGKLYREVRIMKMLHHPNIVKLYEVIETKNTMFLVMELSSGGELYDYLVVHGKMKEKEARQKFRQIVSAVSYCHKKKVIHRDLKAENLLLDSNLDIKIADFGFSNLFDPDSKLDTFCGSPPYAAPELFQGRKYTGPEVDIWSMGVILYVLTTGCLPFDGKNLQEMRESVCKGKYRIPFYLSDTCEKLLRKLLVRDPVKRGTLELFIDDPWINENFDHSPIVKDLGEKVEEDEQLIKLIEAKFHVDRNTILKSIRENVYDDIAAVYYLIYHEKETRGRIEADVLASPTHASPDGTSKAKQAPMMGRIEEDNINLGHSGSNDNTPQLRQPPPAAKPNRRRFTVGNDKEVEKMAEEDQEAAKLLSKLQQPNTPSTTKASKDLAKEFVKPAAVPVKDTHTPSKSVQPPSTAEGSETDPSDKRKRHNTIVGILRNTIYRPTDSNSNNSSNSPTSDKGGDIPGHGNTQASDSISDVDAFEPTKPGEEGKPRSLRFTFNSSTTSSKPADDLIKEVVSVCGKLEITNKVASRYLVECHWFGGNDNPEEGIKFEVEVCRLPRLKNLHGLRFKRTSGSSNDYKEICEKLVGALQL